MRDITCKRGWLNWKSFLILLPILNLATEAFAQTDPSPSMYRQYGGSPLSAHSSLWDSLTIFTVLS